MLKTSYKSLKQIERLEPGFYVKYTQKCSPKGGYASWFCAGPFKTRGEAGTTKERLGQVDAYQGRAWLSVETVSWRDIVGEALDERRARAEGRM